MSEFSIDESYISISQLSYYFYMISEEKTGRTTFFKSLYV